MRKVILGIAIVAAVTTANSQVLRLVRTDPVTYPTIVTATRLFGFDILADSITGLTTVSFELRYTGAQYVRLAAWKPRQLSRNNVYVLDRSDTATGVGSIHIAVFADDPSAQQNVANRTVVHLDFVVLPHTPHKTALQFDAINPEAVIAGPPPRLVPLRAQSVGIVVHSFVTVFPGDANNDGRVTQRDFSTVALYLGQGTTSGQVRGFRRDIPSTLWQPQRALAWEDEAATYADCDGSGDITLADALVVKINFDSTHALIGPLSDPLPSQQKAEKTHTGPTATIAFSEQAVRALALECLLPTDCSELELCSPDEQWNIDFFTSAPQCHRAWAILSSSVPRDAPTISLQWRSSTEVRVPPPTIVNAYALLDGTNSIVPVQPTLLSVPVQEYEQRCLWYYPHPASATVAIVTESAEEATLYACNGRAIHTYSLAAGTTVLDVSDLESGTYWLHTARCNVPVMIIR
ncbi:MAG: dockerin type I domain-containing protein [Chlorobi bacterium]|nr:dockerin type I domain-containing protein [Chlorobiota bacterium]